MTPYVRTSSAVALILLLVGGVALLGVGPAVLADPRATEIGCTTPEKPRPYYVRPDRVSLPQ